MKLTQRQERIIFLRSAIQRTQMHHDRTVLYANYWIAQATTGIGINRNMQKMTGNKRSDGSSVWRDMTDKEKIEEALLTANNHIHNMEENMEALIKFREELDVLEIEESDDD